MSDRRRLADARGERLLRGAGAEQVDLGVSAILQPLPWDSETLGRDCRQLHLFPGPAPLYRADLGSAVELLAWDFLFSRIEAADVRSLHALQGAGFDVVESLVTFAAAPTDGASAEALGEADAAEAVAIMEASFTDGRYLVDPAIPHATGMAAYKTWAANAVAGRIGDAALGLREGNELAGFVTLTHDREIERVTGRRIASIGLIAVRPASQGRGIGRTLMNAAMAWCRREDCTTLTVGTQTSNIPAQRLYTGLGFRPVYCEVSLRRVRP